MYPNGPGRAGPKFAGPGRAGLAIFGPYRALLHSLLCVGLNPVPTAGFMIV